MQTLAYRHLKVFKDQACCSSLTLQGIQEPSVYVITPYNRQCHLLEDMLVLCQRTRWELKAIQVSSACSLRHYLNWCACCCLIWLAATLSFCTRAQVMTVDKAQGSEADAVVSIGLIESVDFLHFKRCDLKALSPFQCSRGGIRQHIRSNPKCFNPEMHHQ